MKKYGKLRDDVLLEAPTAAKVSELQISNLQKMLDENSPILEAFGFKEIVEDAIPQYDPAKQRPRRRLRETKKTIRIEYEIEDVETGDDE